MEPQVVSSLLSHWDWLSYHELSPGISCAVSHLEITHSASWHQVQTQKRVQLNFREISLCFIWRKRREKGFKQLAQDGMARRQNLGGDSFHPACGFRGRGNKLAFEHSFGQQMLKVPCKESHIMDFWYLVNWGISKVGLMHPTNQFKRETKRFLLIAVLLKLKDRVEEMIILKGQWELANHKKGSLVDSCSHTEFVLVSKMDNKLRSNDLYFFPKWNGVKIGSAVPSGGSGWINTTEWRGLF